MTARVLNPSLAVRTGRCAVFAIAAFAIAAFAILTTAILRQDKWDLREFDQLFYTTIAYDLDRYGTFTNGFFHKIDSTESLPPAGMFFVPVYPILVLAAMK